ncbi:MAG: hypothetical protein CL607_15015 [Anaerolineaceae bacterium]|nr:hypothetical protein [Anaerolineaceae bacterium]
MGLRQRVRQVVSELIGNARRTIDVWSNRIWSHRPSIDWQRVDYAFYDKLWRGQALGLEISGLLVKPISSKIVAWVLGQAPDIGIAEDEPLQGEVNDWWQANEGRILEAAMEAEKLGDVYIILNGDGTISLVQPDIVTPIVDEDDYSQIIGWRVNAVYPHPESAKTMTISDEYYADQRVRVMLRDGREIDRQPFRNPLGRIPVVHVPGPGKGVNDKWGRPRAEAMLNALHAYGQVLDSGLDGNYRQGRPSLGMKFDSVQAMDKFWDTYATTTTQTLPDGTTESTVQLDIDMDGVITYANAEAKYLTPGSSSTDVMNFLQILYYLILEHTELPEFLMGSAIQGSKASAETQMPPFIKFIEKEQKLIEGWVMDLVDLVVAYTRTVAMRRTATDISVKVLWPKLTDDDHRLTLDTLKWAYGVGLVDDENAVRLMPVEIEDPEAMLAKLKAAADQAAKDRGDAFDAAMKADAADADEDQPDAQMIQMPIPLNIGSEPAYAWPVANT